MSGGADTPGPGVDASGRAVLDPTRNVLDLVEAAIQRQDDLRESEAKHVREVAQIRSAHAHELRQIETARLNAIREVDNATVQRSAEVVAVQAQTLANTLAQTAEAMRTQVAAQAVTTATALDAKIAPLQSAIADLQRFQFEAQGQKTQVVETQAKGTSTGLLVGLVLTGVFGLLGFLIGAVGLVYALSR